MAVLGSRRLMRTQRHALLLAAWALMLLQMASPYPDRFDFHGHCEDHPEGEEAGEVKPYHTGVVYDNLGTSVTARVDGKLT